MEVVPKEAQLYWIHCNRCFEIYMKKQRAIYILTCQHLACEICAKPAEGNTFVCPICNKNVRGRQLGNALPTHIKELFHPTPWADGLPTAHILRFQQRHRDHFMQGMDRMSREYERLKQSCEQVRASAKEKYETLENLRAERRQLEMRVRKVSKMRRQMEKRRSCSAPPPSTRVDAVTNSRPYYSRPRYPSTQVSRPHSAGSHHPLALNNPRMLSPIEPTNFAYGNVSFAL